jgi:hypothetical protein
MRKIASLVAAAVLLSIASAGLLLAQQAPTAAGAPPAGPGAGAPGRGGAVEPARLTGMWLLAMFQKPLTTSPRN